MVNRLARLWWLLVSGWALVGQTQHGVTLTPLDPVMVDESLRSARSGTGATIEFVNQSGRAVDIYWINFSGDRVLYKPALAAGASYRQPTYLKHPWLVVASGTGGTTEHGSGMRLAGFEAETPNPTLDSSIHDEAIIASGQNPTTSPRLISKVEPKYSDVALKLRVGDAAVLVGFIVQPDGTTTDFQVTHSFGYGLDENAIEAVRQWRFAPGMKDGKAVATKAQAQLKFHLLGNDDAKTLNSWYAGAMTFSLAPGVTPPAVEDGSMPKPGSEPSSGRAVLAFTVGTTGAVTNVRAISGEEAATQLLGQYLAGWMFRPAEEGGKAVEATGVVEFSMRNQGEPVHSAAKPMGNPLDMLLGEYRHEPVANKSHVGTIGWDMPYKTKLRWTNEAGVSWALTADLKNGILATDAQSNPYYNSDPEKGRSFRLRMRADGQGVEGFEFRGEFYAKVKGAPAANPQTTECVAPRPGGMVGWWPGDSNANDIVGGHNPTGINAVSLAPGQVMRGFKFGFEGYLEIPKSAGLENQRFTWLAWVRPDGPGPNASSIIVNQNIDGTHAAVDLAWRPADERFTFQCGSARDELIVSKDAYPAGGFYLAAATYDGAVFRLYVNGELEGALAEAKTVPYSEYGWEIGAGALRFFPRAADTFNGVIDEVQAYDRALGVEEIQAIFRAGSAGVCKGAAGTGGTRTEDAGMVPPVLGAPAREEARQERPDVQPRLVSKVEPHYSEAARQAKYSGTVLLSVEIDTKGRPTNPRVVRPLGLGLDEEAIKAVLKWRFKPAEKNGKPVAVRAQVEVTFRLL